ncbi:uncharacterized protein A1O9_08894 [Exophiala aquamarina CBS 119918]|uniref:FAD-binding domain-containing protein n=1 Tax=Exophiala aquamarina CBS 119918 TaxID=1182545 RepID=A0A072PIA2_9EURO|nr:uncharacterized protein A1O9_08894 [Exophiala aquamarina CBS 119918]KEF55240.1 hypothetical protein A1O9_08894 [Exophiala aquamarina CBS 119918]
MTPTSSSQVAVVGAGPAGLLLALILAQNGLTVTVLEANEKVDDRPRALLYGPAASQVIRRAGIIHKVLERGFLVKSMAWRKLGGEKITEIENIDTLDVPDHMLAYPLNLLAEIIVAELAELPNASIQWSHRVINVSEDNDKVWAEVDYRGEKRSIGADFLVACDGAQSGVRKALFGREFPGYSLGKQMVTTNVYYDLEKYGWSDIQWTIHPEHWFISMKITKDGLWRVAYGDDASFSEDELKQRLPDKFRKILPGNPEPDQYKIKTMASFRMHQRCAPKMKVGRVLLGGDAAHLCNPMGGLGLTGGIADMGSLTDCLLGIYSGQADIDILDKYDEMRRRIYQDVINPLSITNMERMSKDAECVLENDPFLQFAAEAGQNPEVAAQMFMVCDLRPSILPSDI